MEKLSPVTLEEMKSEAKLFQSVYPELVGEIIRIESSRGHLSEFQMMAAVSHAKKGLGVLSYERRQSINLIFESFKQIYLEHGFNEAHRWAQEVLGCGDDLPYAGSQLGQKDKEDRLRKLSFLIQVKESELLELYREYYQYQNEQPD
ncbi:hypothetical protein N6H14_27745 [Paenibacillus sp. CC-CFT747]|nr:hypothetical protein N6H14_27745 [Paenibacillus sp. CC-CFT747]